MKNEIINHLGEERAKKIESQRRGAIGLGLKHAEAEGAKGAELVTLGAIRALQAAGSRPTAKDLEHLAAARQPVPEETTPDSSVESSKKKKDKKSE